MTTSSSALASSGTVALYRLFNGTDHFYTADSNERNVAISTYGYRDEGIACYVSQSPTPGTVALYRLANSKEHFYTADPNERNAAISTYGYRDEGIACYVSQSAASGTVALYRLFNGTDHFYTIDPNERDAAISKAGYHAEGIACYVWPTLVQTSFVSVKDGHFSLNGKPFRHVGANAVSLIYRSQGEAINDLNILQRAGVKHVRVLLPNNRFTNEEVANRLQWVLDQAYSRDIRLTLVLTDVYGGYCWASEGRSGIYCPPGDEEYHTIPFSDVKLYNHVWFESGYKRHYLPFVEYIVPRFRNHSGVFSWHVGGELKDSEVEQGKPIDAFMNFYSYMSMRIKQLDSNHLVGAGLLNTHHPSLTSLNKREEFYSNPNLNYVSISIYDEDAEKLSQRIPPDNDAVRDRIDRDLASKFNKPFVVHEVGFAKSSSHCTNKRNYYSDPVGEMSKFFASAYDFYSADAVLPWGCQFGTPGSGDWCYGPLEQNLVENYVSLFKAWADLLNKRNSN